MMKGMERLKKAPKAAEIFKKLKTKFSELSTAKKVQVVMASFLTLVLVIGLPVYAWFALSGKLEAFTKIKEPDALDIRAGHFDAVQYFNLNDIDIAAMVATEPQTPHRVVFSVSAGDYKIPYQLQLAHTTNIPFEYRIFRAEEYSAADYAAANDQDSSDVKYISMPLKEQGKSEAEYTFYYKKKMKEVDGQQVADEVKLSPKNPDNASPGQYGRTLAIGSGNYYDATYDEGDAPEVYAVPIYEQSGRITYDPNSEHDFFILEISWDEDANTVGNFSE